MDNISRLCPFAGRSYWRCLTIICQVLCKYNAQAILSTVQTLLLLSTYAHMGTMLLRWGLCPVCSKEDLTWIVVCQTSRENL